MSAETRAVEPEDAVIEQAIMSLPDADNALDAVTEIMMSNPEVFEANQTVAELQAQIESGDAAISDLQARGVTQGQINVRSGKYADFRA